MAIRSRRSESGFVSVELMAAVSLSLVFLVFVFNFIFIQYGEGVIRAAADEGARAGSRVDVVGAPESTLVACEKKANEILVSIGKMASDPQVSCTVDDATQRVNSTVTATFEPWMPWIPSIDTEATASSIKEQAPQ